MTTKTEVTPNVTREEYLELLRTGRLVVIERTGKGETDYYDLYRVMEDGLLLRVIGKGFSYAKDCYPVTGGNFNKARHVIEVIARQLDIPESLYARANFQRIHTP